jgi:hypothetical protein
MDDKRYAAAMELIASGLGAIGAAEIHRAYKDIAKLQKKTKKDGMLEAFVKNHPCPLCGTKKAGSLTLGRELSKKKSTSLNRPLDRPNDA